MPAVGILGTGGYLPDIVVDNQQISLWSGTTPEWIVDRTGIHSRRYATAGTVTQETTGPAPRFTAPSD